MIVTLEPKRAYIDANSTPTAPEPITTRDFGTSGELEHRGRGQDRLLVDVHARAATAASSPSRR